MANNDIDLASLSPAAQKVLSADAPPPAKLLAARGVIPGAKPAEIVTVISVLCSATDTKVAETARGALGKLPPPILNGALAADLPGSVIQQLASAYPNQHEVVTALLRMPRIGTEALEQMASEADERAGELIATNEELMLKNPSVIEKLYLNKRVRMSTADRLIELAVRNNLELSLPVFAEAAAAIRNELIMEAMDEPSPEDVDFKEVGRISEAIVLREGEETHELDDEGKELEAQKLRPLKTPFNQLTVSGKIRRVTLGSAADRALAVRDPNRLVAVAAVKSPLMKESEAAMISASRAVNEDVLRTIALNREFVRSYQIKLILVTNPRCPLTFATRMIPHLRESDLKNLAKSKNISAAISSAVRQQLSRKSK
jgi:hypothetical protein